jgi:ribosomal protein S13
MGEIFSIKGGEKITPEEIEEELIKRGVDLDGLKQTIDLREIVNDRIKDAKVENMTEEEMAHLRDEIAETLMHSGDLRVVEKDE